MKRLPLPIALCLILTACSPIEKQARDTAAALNGLLTTAQEKYQDTCKSVPTTTNCQVIHKAVLAQNALITATEAYCGFAVGQPVTDAKCTPVKTAEQGLKTAITNAQPFINELKGIIQ